MPFAVQAILVAAAVVSALGVLWSKLGRPTWKIAKAADELVPLLRDFTEAFRGTPQVFLVLDEIARQFRTDSGSSLRDVVNRLEALINEQALAGEAARQLSADDRRTLARLVLLLDLVDAKADTLTSDRADVAANLERAQAAVEGVANDLAAAHARADATSAGDAGAAADAASRTPEENP